ncbi:MAG TPA: ThuA domain-containing protein [Ilumatobacteraceae bacterium]|nr:ThuA domain-containing protein [Ilumatobacteraceae bacterium]
MSVDRSRLRILVFHRAVGFVHLSIPDAVAAIECLGDEYGFGVDATDDPARFTDDLGRYDALVFVHTSGNVLPEGSQRAALERYVANGGGFFGIHAASSMAPDVDTDWPWFRDLVGATFKGHTVARVFTDDPVPARPGVEYGGPFADAPAQADHRSDGLAVMSCEAATVHVEDPACSAIRGIGDGDVVVDEWYGFHDNPRARVNIVATVDEATYEPYLGEMGADHPIVWWHEFGGGRSVYNSMGHAVAAWSDARFLTTVLGGIDLAARSTSGVRPAR